MIFRPIVVMLTAALLSVQIARNAAVEALAADKPDLAARVWSGHPAVERSARK